LDSKPFSAGIFSGSSAWACNRTNRGREHPVCLVPLEGSMLVYRTASTL
jgi:hypothetical protein